jgi:hypothetical protein
MWEFCIKYFTCQVAGSSGDREPMSLSWCEEEAKIVESIARNKLMALITYRKSITSPSRRNTNVSVESRFSC